MILNLVIPSCSPISALIVELSIKIIWLLENNTNNTKELPRKQRRHDIDEIFEKLQCKTKSEIQKIYCKVRKEIKEKYEINNEVTTLEKVLAWNKSVIIDYKFNPSFPKGFTEENLIFVQYGSIWQKK